MAIPVISPAMVVSLKLRSLNRFGDMIGSTALRSTATSAATPTTVATIRAMIRGELQEYVVPPHVVKSTKPVEEAARSTMPATSRRGLAPAAFGRCRKNIADAIAAIQIGRE